MNNEDLQDTLGYVLSPTEVVALSDEARKAMATAWDAARLVADLTSMNGRMDAAQRIHKLRGDGHLDKPTCLELVAAALTPGDTKEGEPH